MEAMNFTNITIVYGKGQTINIGDRHMPVTMRKVVKDDRVRNATPNTRWFHWRENGLNKGLVRELDDILLARQIGQYGMEVDVDVDALIAAEST